MPSFLSEIARGLRCTLEPLQVSLKTSGGIEQLIENFGWEGTIDGAGLAQIQSAFSGAEALFNTIQDLANQIESGTADELTVAKDLLDAVRQLIGLIQGLASAPPGGLPAPLDQPAFWAEVPLGLLDFLVLRFIEVQWAPLYASLIGLGLVDISQVTPAGAGRKPFIKQTLQWDALPALFTHPEQHFQNTYHWSDGTPFDYGKLLENLKRLFWAIEVPTRLGPPRPTLATRYFNPANPALPQLKELDIPLMTLASGDRSVYAEVGLLILPIPPKGNNNQAPNGFVISPIATGSMAAAAGSGAPFDFQLKGGFGTDGAFGIEVRPGSVDLQIAPGPTTMDAQFSVTGNPPKPWVLVGSPDSHRLQLAGLWIAISLKGDVTDPEVILEFGTGPHAEQKGALVIQASDADSFLQTIFGSEPQKLEFGVKLAWSSRMGFHITGGAAIEINLPLHLDLGVAHVTELTLRFGLSGGNVSVMAALTGDAEIGPITATVDKIGVQLNLVPPPAGHSGNLGSLDLSFGFKPPNGLGLAIDAGPIAGGGYISFDPDHGEYTGVLSLALEDTVQITAIGILDTVMPDGSQGYSFLLVLTFGLPPIQLGFGFTLNGVGGLVGIQRTMSVDALHAGFRAHTLNTIMFPSDPVGNAPQIISNLKSFFPPAEGRYTFGPMLEFGWGTPSLITLSIGLLIEVPDPVRIVILGLIAAGLPTQDEALIELHIDILGVIDFSAKKISIDGTIYDSRILVFTLMGDLAFRLSWGDNPSFIYSLGGFNPHFNTAGLDVPQMHRMSVSIGDGDNPRISANSYIAFTSNSFQLGANVDAYAAACGFSLHGYLGFDVLIIFSPFSFEFDFYAGFDVAFEGMTLLGISVNGSFSGPRPWHLHGDASLQILFFSVSVSVDLTWGDSTPVGLPAKPVLPDLLAALQDARNWSAALPDGSSQVVSLLQAKPTDTALRVHPLGTLTVRESVVPLDLPIQRYGSATPSDGDEFSITGVTVNGSDEANQPVSDYFAAGQFLALSDADKLSRPSFESYHAGVAIGAAGIQAGADSPRTVTYEERYVDDPASGFSRFTTLYQMPAALHDAFTRQGAGYLSPLKNSGLSKYQSGAKTSPIAVADPSYVIAQTDDLSVRSDVFNGEGGTYYGAKAALATHLLAHPEESDNLQILPLHEVTA